MAPSMDDIQRLLRRLEDAQAVVTSTQTSLHEALLQALNQAEPHRSPRPQLTSYPSTIDEDDISITAPARQRGRRESVESRKTGHSTIVDGVKQQVNSIYSDDSSDSDSGESFFATEPLPAETFNEDGLREHLDGHNFDVYSELILQPLLNSHRYQRKGSLFATDASDDEEDYDAQHHDADVYEVDKDGAPRKKVREDSKEGGDHSQLWNVLRQTNNDESRTQKAVGRIVVMREPTPLLCAALHYTMSPHFDMDSIFRILIDDTINTRAYVDGHRSKDRRQQRSIVFMLKYHTLVGKDREPLAWQNHDDDVVEKLGHIPISTCSAVVALSLAGEPARHIRSHSRKSKKRAQISTIYDPFNPWHVLSIQCFPDWHSETNLHETKHHYVNGPDAFLATLLNEYTDATKRFKELSQKILDLATPPKRVVFDAHLRDDLLFENHDFVWSRRYFWAAQALQILSEEIEAMITAYEDTFTEEFWAGEHKTLFFGTADMSARYNNFRKKLAHTHKGFEKEIKALREILKKCNRDQKHIRMLREWLFSGTSVLESRSARKQDYNIKWLTLVTICFLPLMFVTSVFGMTNMHQHENFVHFGIATVCICIPTYWVIILISYYERLAPVKQWCTKKWHELRHKDPAILHGPKRRNARDKRVVRPGGLQRTATNVDLQERIRSLSDTPRRPSFTPRNPNDSREVRQNGTVGSGLGPRRSTVQFSEPFRHPRHHDGAGGAEQSPNTSDVETATTAARTGQPRPEVRSINSSNLQQPDADGGSILRRLSLKGRSKSEGEVPILPV